MEHKVSCDSSTTVDLSEVRIILAINLKAYCYVGSIPAIMVSENTIYARQGRYESRKTKVIKKTSSCHGDRGSQQLWYQRESCCMDHFYQLALRVA